MCLPWTRLVQESLAMDRVVATTISAAADVADSMLGVVLPLGREMLCLRLVACARKVRTYPC